MKTFVFVFLTSFLLYVVTAAPAPHRSPSSRSKLSARDRQLLRDILCILQGKTASGCIDSENEVEARKRRIESPTMEEEEVLTPEGLTSLHGVPDRRDAFYSDWRRRK